MFIKYPNKGTCRYCSAKASTSLSTICRECRLDQWRAQSAKTNPLRKLKRNNQMKGHQTDSAVDSQKTES